MGTEAIPHRPQLKPWYRLVHGETSLVLEFAGTAVVLEGEATTRLLPALLPLLDGTRSVDEITTTLGEPAEPAIRNALELLGHHGLLTEPFADGPPPVPIAETARFLAATSARNATPPSVADAVSRAAVVVAGDGPVASEVARLLRLSGVAEVDRASVEGPAPAVGLAIVAAAPCQLPHLTAWNASALDRGTPWLAALPFDGQIAAVGPLVVPGETCCFECYVLRRASNSGYFAEHLALQQAQADFPVSPVVVAVTAGLTTLIALRWLVERDPAFPGVLFALELAGAPRLAAHHVYRVPRCPACSTVARTAPVLPWFERDDA